MGREVMDLIYKFVEDFMPIVSIGFGILLGGWFAIRIGIPVAHAFSQIKFRKRKAHDHDYQEYTDAELGLERLADGEVVEHILGDTKIPKQNVTGSSPVTR